MGRESTIQTSFNAGELSPLMLARIDLKKREAGLFTCVNGITLAQGAWTRRPGSLFLKEVKFSNRLTRVFPFQFSVQQTYVLEFGHQYIRFFTQHGILTLAGQSITGITKANPAVLSYSGADTYTNGDRVYVTGVVGMTQVNNREFIVANVNTGANTFELQEWINGAAVNVNSTGYDTYSSGGTVAEVFEIVSPYAEADLSSIRIVQSADTLYILHPNYIPRKLVRVSALSWALSVLVFVDGPYDTENQTTTTLTPSATTGAITITASAVTGINNDTGFQAGDVGRLVRIKNGTTWGYAEITSITSTTLVNATVHSAFAATTATAAWRLGVWSTTTGFPRCGTFFDDRLIFAGAASFPQRLDGSRTGKYQNFSPSANDGTVAADNAIAFTLNSNDVNAIRWLVDNEKGLQAGTARGEWQIRPSALNEALTPTNISGKPSTKHGSEFIQPVVAGKATLFVQRSGKKLRELAYVFESDGFKAPDMSLLAEHITRPSITEITYQEQPQAIVWGIRSDGVFLGFTYERDQDVVGWHRHELGGFSDAADTLIPVVESMTVVPAPDVTRDELYMVVRRHVNGFTKRYIELLTKMWEDGDDQEDAFHVDCGWTEISSPPDNTVTGLWHLEGETVSALVDGTKHPNVTVTNGTITLNRAVSVVNLGYPFQSDGVMLPIEGGAQEGTAQGKIKRIFRVGFWLVDTLGLKYGPDMTKLTEILVRTWGDVMGEATPLFTGVFRGRFESDYDKLGQVHWRCDGPFPATVLAVMPQVQTSDDS